MIPFPRHIIISNQILTGQWIGREVEQRGLTREYTGRPFNGTHGGIPEQGDQGDVGRMHRARRDGQELGTHRQKGDTENENKQ